MNIMNVSLALFHGDEQYRDSFLHSFSEFYSQTEIYSFSNVSIMAEAVSQKPVDVLLVSENIYNTQKDLFSSKKIRCKALVILTKGRGINKIGNCPAVCQYQIIDKLYQELVGIYAEHTDALMNMTSKSGETRVSTFISGAGGCGCSVSAAAYSVYLASGGNKVIYIDMSSLGMPELMFDGEGSYTLTDCFTAVLSSRNNLNVRLETYTRKDSSEVYYYSSCVNSMDWADITFENKTDFLNCLISESGYDRIVVDLPCEWNELAAFMYEKSEKFYIVSNGKTVSNAKSMKLIDTIFTYIRSKNADSSKLKAVYASYSDSSVKLQDNRIDEYTVLPKITRAINRREMLEKLSLPDIWGR